MQITLGDCRCQGEAPVAWLVGRTVSRCQASLDSYQVFVDICPVEIASIRHKALRNFAETGKAKGLPGSLVERIRNMLAYLDAIASADELFAPPNFGAHQLTGDRAGVWSLTVTRNWRLTFRINDALEIEGMDLEDYH